MDYITDCINGADGGVAFINLQSMLANLIAQAEAGDKNAEQALVVVRQFATLIKISQEMM